MQELQLPTTPKQISISGIQGIPVQSSTHITTCYLSPTQVASNKLQVSAAVVKKVSSTLPLQGVAAVKQLSHIQQLKLADPTFYQSGKIDILLGGDVLPQVMLPDMKTGAANSPVAWNTIFGWVIFGPFQSGQKSNNSHTHCMNHFVHDEIPSNNPTKQVGKPEESPINLVTSTSDEKELQLPIDKSDPPVSSTYRFPVSSPSNLKSSDFSKSKTQAIQRCSTDKSSTLSASNWTTSHQATVDNSLSTNASCQVNNSFPSDNLVENVSTPENVQALQASHIHVIDKGKI